MIKEINYKEINILLRNTIIENSDIPEKKILNALTTRGTDLSETINNTQVYSFSANDVFLLFELLKDETKDNFVTRKDDNSMLVISSYKFHLMIYGNGSDDASKIIRAIFHQSSILNNLRDNGIFVTNISSGESINEFINNTLLLRNDLMLNLETVFKSINKKEQEYFNLNYDMNDIELNVEDIKNL